MNGLTTATTTAIPSLRVPRLADGAPHNPDAGAAASNTAGRTSVKPEGGTSNQPSCRQAS